MNVARGIIMLGGIVVVLAGAYLLYFEADLSRWVSIGILTAGILVFVGMSIMAFAGGARTDPVAAQPTRVVQDNREVVRSRDPR